MIWRVTGPFQSRKSFTKTACNVRSSFISEHTIRQHYMKLDSNIDCCYEALLSKIAAVVFSDAARKVYFKKCYDRSSVLSTGSCRGNGVLRTALCSVVNATEVSLSMHIPAHTTFQFSHVFLKPPVRPRRMPFQTPSVLYFAFLPLKIKSSPSLSQFHCLFNTFSEIHVSTI